MESSGAKRTTSRLLGGQGPEQFIGGTALERHQEAAGDSGEQPRPDTTGRGILFRAARFVLSGNGFYETDRVSFPRRPQPLRRLPFLTSSPNTTPDFCLQSLPDPTKCARQ